MNRLLSELRRRRVFQTAALYIVAAWLALQVADVLLPALDMPERTIRYLLFALVLGFPAVLVAGWFFDIGANIGIYSLYYAKCHRGNVYSFEPSVFNLRQLAKNVSSNNHLFS